MSDDFKTAHLSASLQPLPDVSESRGKEPEPETQAAMIESLSNTTSSNRSRDLSGKDDEFVQMHTKPIMAGPLLLQKARELHEDVPPSLDEIDF